MRTLVVYYSLAGTTRTVATELAKELSADIEEIRCDRYRPGFAGFVKAGYDSWAGRLPPIAKPARMPSRYDLVVIGGPVWAMHAATPVRAYVQQETGQLPSLAFFLTCGGSPTAKALREMESLAGSAAQATLTVREADVKSGAFRSALSGFAATLRQRKAA
jgi:flavodoxin